MIDILELRVKSASRMRPVVQVELEVVEDFTATARGGGGFGHSGSH